MPVSEDANVLQSVALSMRILECLGASDKGWGVTELAGELGVPKARMFRHLHTLRQLGYVAHNPETKRDHVGIRLQLLARMVGENVDLSAILRPVLDELRDQTSHTAVFAAVVDGRPTIIDFVPGTTPVRFTFRPGASFSLNSTALGHISLAFGPSDYWDHLGDVEFDAETPKTVTDPALLPPRVELARKRGWTIVPEEAVIGVNAIAAPVFLDDSGFAGAIAVVGSIQHIPADPPQDLIDAVVAAGQEASRNLGYRAELEDHG